MILFNLALGFYGMSVYHRYKAGEDDAVVTWGLVACCLIMAPFANFINTFAIWFFWFTNRFLMAPRQATTPTEPGQAHPAT